MLNKNFECKPLYWDTDYFGISSARVDLRGSVDKQGQDEIIGFCKDYDFVTISNLNNKKDNNYWLGTRTDSFLADTNIQFIKTLKNKPNCEDHNTYVVNKFLGNKQILDIARNAFLYSRFFNDTALPKEQAKDFYAHWTKSAFDNKNKYFVINEKKGEIAGYILFSMVNDTSIIELIAVDRNYQGQKVGKSLMQTMESFVVEQGINKINVGTQVNNISAFNFYISMGFMYTSCSSTYHLWNRQKIEL